LRDRSGAVNVEDGRNWSVATTATESWIDHACDSRWPWPGRSRRSVVKEKRSRPQRTLDLSKLSGALDLVRHRLDRAEAALLIAVSSRAAAPEVEASLDEVKAAGRLLATLHDVVNDEMVAVPPKVRCGHCQAEMAASASRCGACWRVTAKA
jgi:hypothetical protein